MIHILSTIRDKFVDNYFNLFNANSVSGGVYNHNNIKQSDIHNSIIILIGDISASNVRDIDATNKVIKIIPDGILKHNDILISNIVDRFVCFSCQASYRLAYNLKSAKIPRPVYSITPFGENCLCIAGLCEKPLDKDGYIIKFMSMIDGKTHDYCETWISDVSFKANNYIVPKQIIENGALTQVPAKFNQSYRILKTLELEQLLNYLSNIPFSEVYVFDVEIESIDNIKIDRINRLIRILGNRIKNIHFCLDKPPEWGQIEQSLYFTTIEEGSKGVQT